MVTVDISKMLVPDQLRITMVVNISGSRTCRQNATTATCRQTVAATLSSTSWFGGEIFDILVEAVRSRGKCFGMLVERLGSRASYCWLAQGRKIYVLAETGRNVDDTFTAPSSIDSRPISN